MFCARCDKPIRPGQPYKPYDIMSPTGPGTTVYLHVKPCTPVPTQTTQASIRH
jgi:hypothetical protein